MKRTFLTLLVVVALVATLATPAAAASVNPDADEAHNPYISTNVTKAQHPMGWATTEYEDDSGDLTELPAEVNSTQENPYALTYTDVDTSAYTEFPRNTGDSGVDTWTNGSQWTTDDSGSVGTISVSETTTAQNVEAISVSTSSQTGGDTASASFAGFNVTSDAQKRYLQLALDVNQLESSADVTIRAVDQDGDYVAAELDPDDDPSQGNNMTNSVGEGYVFQQQVGALTTMGSGDGSMDEIREIKVVVEDANADIDIAAMNAERTSPWTLGDQRVNNSGNWETETKTQINQSGPTDLVSIGSMGSAFDDATLRDVTVAMQFHSSEQYDGEDDRERANQTWSNASAWANYDDRLNDYRRFKLPDAYDLSYSNAEVEDTVEVPGSRYQTVEYATNAGDTAFSNISYTETTSSYSGLGDTVDVTSGINAGEEFVIHYDYVVTSEERQNMESSEDSGGGGAPMEDDDSGGLLFGIPNALAAGIATVLGFLGLRRFGG